MFSRDPPPTFTGATSPKPSPVAQAISWTGGVTGLGAAILGTPLVYGLTSRPLERYLQQSWGPDLGSGLTALFGVLEFILIFSSVRLVTTMGITTAVASLAARRINT